MQRNKGLRLKASLALIPVTPWASTVMQYLGGAVPRGTYKRKIDESKKLWHAALTSSGPEPS